jgi:hypothetical protein
MRHRLGVPDKVSKPERHHQRRALRQSMNVQLCQILPVLQNVCFLLTPECHSIRHITILTKSQRRKEATSVASFKLQVMFTHIVLGIPVFL